MTATWIGVNRTLLMNGAVITTSGGNIYVFAAASGYLYIWKSTDGGGSFNGLTPITAATVTGESISRIHAAIDGAGYIHIVAAAASLSATRDIAYNKLNTANDTLGSWEQAAVYTKTPLNKGVFIAIDGSNYPHILYIDAVANMGTDYTRAYYTNKVGGSWLTPEMVSTGTQTSYGTPRICVRASDVVEATYNGPGYPYRRTKTSGSWNTETQFSGSPYVGTRITATSGGTVYRYTHSTSGTQGVEDNSAIGSIAVYNAETHTFDASLVSNIRYVFYVDNSDQDVKWLSNSGSEWDIPTVIESGTWTRIICEWAYNYEYQSGRINYIFDDGTTLYFNYLTLGPTPTEESVLLGKKIYLMSDSQVNIKDIVFLGKSLPVTGPSFNNTNEKDSLIIVKYIELTSEGIKIGGTTEESVSLSIFIGISNSNYENISENILLTYKTYVSILDQIIVQNDFILSKFKGISLSNQVAVSDSISLQKFNEITFSNQISIQEISNLLYSLGINILEDNSYSEESIILTKSIGIIFTNQINIQEIVNFLHSFVIDIIGDIPGIEETITLAKSNIITISDQVNINNSTILEKFIGIITNSELNINNIIILEKFATTSLDNIINLFDGTILDKFKGILIGSDGNFLDLVSLISYLGIVTEGIPSGGVIDETISLGLILRVSQPLSQNIEENVTLVIYSGIISNSQIILSNEITLNRIITEDNREIANVIDAMTLAKINTIENTINTNENDFVNLLINKVIDLVTQTNENDSKILGKFVGVVVSEELQGIEESVTLSYFLTISTLQEGISYVNESTVLNRLTGISETTQCQVNNNALLNRLVGISETTQCQINDNILLNRVVDISETTQCQVNNSLSLSKFIYINIIDETIGQYSEILTLTRSIGISIFQEGISHVSESAFLNRSNLININEQSIIYNNLIFTRSNGIIILPQSQINNNLIFARSNGLSLSTQIAINENITVSKFSIFNTFSQLVVNELLSLFKLNNFVILDSRYLLENINLGRSNDLILISNPTIFEMVELRKINIITIMTVLFGFNNINLDQFKSIIGEPQSLYVYNDGNHSVEVLFRDKRTEVLFRDKSAKVLFRDKSVEVLLRDKPASVIRRDKRGG